MEKDKVYISGAIAHYDLEERKNTFLNAERYLSLKGFDPVNLFKNGLPDEAHWWKHMRANFHRVLGCEYIYMLRGWEHKGTKQELDVASSCVIKRILKDIRVEMGDEFDRNFERQAFFSETWARRKSPTRPGGSILIDTGSLRKSIGSRTTENSIVFYTTLPYAAIHNDGGG